MNTTLEEIRKEWEKNLTPIAKHMNQYGDMLLVVLTSEPKRDGLPNYHCHRYYKLGDNWVVSVDGRRVDVAKALKWAMNPLSICKEEDND